MPDPAPAPGSRRIVVKFKSEVRLPHTADAIRVIPFLKAQLGIDWDALAELFPGIVWEPYFTGIHPAVLQKFDRLTPPNDPNPIALNSFFVIDNIKNHDRQKILAELRKLPKVETAYVEVGLAAPPSSADPLNINQNYQDDAPRGIGSRSFSDLTGCLGAGIGFVDLEQGWKLDHEDLKDAAIPAPIWGENRRAIDHGTAVLGIIAATAGNPFGGKGIAPAASANVVSILKPGILDRAFTALAILHAACAMLPGDLLLIEHQIYASETDFRTVPVEADLATFHVIRALTLMGIHVVEAAGNGTVNLDEFKDSRGLEIFNTSVRDSGAILVAAAKSADYDREPTTNFGSRVNCFAWGDGILTTWSNSSGTTSDYKLDFGQTSGASAIVAGAAILLLSWRKQTTGTTFSVRQLRELLSDSTLNTPSKDRFKDRIGYMPNLMAIRNNIETLDALVMEQQLKEMAARANGKSTAKILAKSARRIRKTLPKRSR